MFQKRASKRAQRFPMTDAWPRLQRMFIAAFFALGASSAAAHEFKLGALMNTFVKIDSGACARAPLRAGRPRGDDHPLGDCCPYRLALDGRALGRAVEGRVAESRLGRRRCGSALDCGAD